MKLSLSLGVLVAVMVASAVLATGTGAERGIGVTLGLMNVEETLKPGREYALPNVGVLNTGSQSDYYQVVVSYDDSQPRKQPPEKWFSLEPDRFSLLPGETQQVAIKVTLPAGADIGDYFAFIEARLDSNDPAQTIEAGVATKLFFTVSPSSWLDAKVAQINRFLDNAQPWSYILPLLLIAALFLHWSRKRMRLRLPFEWKQ